MYDTEVDPFASPSGQELLRNLQTWAQENVPDTWQDTSYTTQAAGFILANGWTALDHAHIVCPEGTQHILTENGLIKE